MSKDNKFVIRRTVSQERFEVLWTKRRNGQATLRDLTEMDEIINRDEGVRQFVLGEMESEDNPTRNNNDFQNTLQNKQVVQHSFSEKVKAFLNKLFRFEPSRLQNC